MSIKNQNDAVEPTATSRQDYSAAKSVSRNAARRWTARLGLLSGVFFLGKGLVWLTIAALAIDGCAR